MTPAEFKEMAKEHLKITIFHADNRVKVCLMFDAECIDFDFIDYSEVVRVVDRLNKESCH